MPEAFPKLRHEIDAAPIGGEGESHFIIYDRSGIAPTRLLASPLALLVASRLDGASSALEIADLLAEETGNAAFTASEVESIVDALREALFIDNARFHDYRDQADRDFRTAGARPPGSAGSAYPEGGSELAADLDRMLADAPPPEEAADPGGAHPRGVVVPHIDFMRGAPGYGQLYKYLSGLERPRSVVVLGTAHLPITQRFSLCEKDFETPLGTVRVDPEACARIRGALAGISDPDADLLAHRGEHSIELQAVWLRHIYGDAVRIAPVLAGSLGEFIETSDVRGAAEDPVVKAFADALAELVEEGGVMLMASADLSHVGPRFGDDRAISHSFLAEVEEADREYLAAAAYSAVAGLESLAKRRDRYHVCGSAPIFAMGQSLPGARGRLLGYHQAATPELRQAVTYASMSFA
ncbi:MAG: AmmeMemoRadiSam system protein B [Planctomycetota bacterium]|jgi:AmmeMemoRadiSam system protein B|nr:AmmeMemoRadiSam system protein B [Planctomycetota bacterium]